MWDRMFYIQSYCGTASDIAGFTGVKMTYSSEPNHYKRHFNSKTICMRGGGDGWNSFLIHHYRIITECL